MPRDSTSIRIKYLIISLATVAALILYASTFSEPVLRVSLLPDESPSFMRRKFKPLSDYLEKKIGMKIFPCLRWELRFDEKAERETKRRKTYHDQRHKVNLSGKKIQEFCPHRNP